MTQYIATFSSHFDALTCFGALKEQGFDAKLMPVPRKVSASCGTCVSFHADFLPDTSGCDIETLYAETARGQFTAIEAKQ